MTDYDLAPPDVALNLALAMVASSTAPLLLLDGDLKVIAASASFCRAFETTAADVQGREIFDLGDGEWNLPQLRALLDVTASGDAHIEAYEMDLETPGRASRRLVVNAHKLDYGRSEDVRLLVTLSDVTEARVGEKLKDELIREKAVLLQEVQHRVANSLQIIASLILQTARKVQSEETRTHLHDAHSRVMSVAALQQQLSASQVGEVELRVYFTKLCQSIGASMIRDHNQLALQANVDDSVVTADVSISLGLVVTELVINALKHAFPPGRRGKITVNYEAKGPDWTLSVSDNGVGMPSDAAETEAGLGTNIVAALAKKLRADIDVTDTHPGTTVSLIHSEAAFEPEPSIMAIKPAA
jgi:two-component sensor histidine kinase